MSNFTINIAPDSRDGFGFGSVRVFGSFVTARVDVCNMVLASSPRFVTDKPQPVLNAATSRQRHQ